MKHILVLTILCLLNFSLPNSYSFSEYPIYRVVAHFLVIFSVNHIMGYLLVLRKRLLREFNIV